MAGTADLRGSRQDLPVTDLFGFLAATGATGTVAFDGDSAGLVAFHRGRVALALSDNGPTLQQVFVGSGLTDPDGWWQASRLAGAGRSVADAVIEAGADPEAVEAVLFEQTVGATFELVLPGAGTFAFLAAEAHPVGSRFTWPVDLLLAEADRRVLAWKAIAASVPTTALVMRPVRRLPADRVEVDAARWAVLAMLDGRRSIADVIREAGSSAFAVCSAVHDLRTAGLVEPLDAAGP